MTAPLEEALCLPDAAFKRGYAELALMLHGERPLSVEQEGAIARLWSAYRGRRRESEEEEEEKGAAQISFALQRITEALKQPAVSRDAPKRVLLAAKYLATGGAEWLDSDAIRELLSRLEAGADPPREIPRVRDVMARLCERGSFEREVITAAPSAEGAPARPPRYRYRFRPAGEAEADHLLRVRSLSLAA